MPAYRPRLGDNAMYNALGYVYYCTLYTTTVEWKMPDNIAENHKDARLEAYNAWPILVQFDAEKQFSDYISRKGISNVFSVIPVTKLNISGNVADNTLYEDCIGHLLDGLSFLPTRPDSAFDCFFRIIDSAGKANSNENITNVVSNIGDRLLSADHDGWRDIIRSLTSAMPDGLYRYAASRLFAAAYGSRDIDVGALKIRAPAWMGQARFDEFKSHYQSGAASSDKEEVLRTREMAAKFLRKYVNSVPSPNIKPGRFANRPGMDLSNPANEVSVRDQSVFITSIIIYTARNERTHGEMMNPFKTSLSNLQTYRKHYYSMLMCYVYALGALSNRFGCVIVKDIAAGVRRNIQLQADFFS